MEKVDAPLETLGIFRCPECGVTDTGRTPIDTDVFELASEASGEILCPECETIIQPPVDPTDSDSEPSVAEMAGRPVVWSRQGGHGD